MELKSKIAFFYVALYYNYILYFGSIVFFNELEIGKNGISTTATVTKWRFLEKDNEKNTYIKYEYKVNQNTYTNRNVFGDKDSWTWIPSTKEVFDKINANSTVEILYHPIKHHISYTKINPPFTIVSYQFIIIIIAFIIIEIVIIIELKFYISTLFKKKKLEIIENISMDLLLSSIFIGAIVGFNIGKNSDNEYGDLIGGCLGILAGISCYYLFYGIGYYALKFYQKQKN